MGIHLVAQSSYDPTDTREKLHEVYSWATKRWLERAELAEVLLSVIGTGENLVSYGPPGTAKTDMVRHVAHCFGGKFFSRQCHPTMTVTTLVGNVDIQAFQDQNVWRYNTTGRLPEANFAVLDEVGRIGGATQDAVLPILNEKEFDNSNGQPIKTPLITVMATSNTIIDDETGAFTDRFLAHIWVDYIHDARAFERLLRADFEKLTPPKVDLDQLVWAITVGIPSVRVPQTVIDAIKEVRSKFRAEKITVSDRRWRKLLNLMQSRAFIIGKRAAVEPEDLTIIQHAVSPDPEVVAQVRKIVGEYAGKNEKLIAQFTTMLAQLTDKMNDLVGADEATRGRGGADLRFEIRRGQRTLKKAIEEALRDGRDASRMEELFTQLSDLQQEVTTKILEFQPQ